MTSQEHFVFFLPDRDGNPAECTTTENSIVIVGANGSGKTRLGVWIENCDEHGIHRIVAQRKLNPSEFTPPKSFTQAEHKIRFGAENSENKRFYKWNNGREAATKNIDDFDDTLAALLAQRNNESNRFRNECIKAEEAGLERPPIKPTKFDILQEIWNTIFPQRELIEDDSKFLAQLTTSSQTIRYPASQMSDGERSVLYLASQILCVPEVSTLIIDEPEVHLHPSLMNSLWTALEKARQDCLFIYITHDVEFAAPRQTSEKYWIKHYDGKSWDMEKISRSDLPEALLLDILGNRRKVLFVEGEKGSLDEKLYSTLFPERYIVPCGSCGNVISRTKAFGSLPLLHSYDVKGLIDRDYRSDNEIESYRSHKVYCLDVAEVENLFIVPEMLEILAEHFIVDSNELKQNALANIVDKRLASQADVQISQATVARVKYSLNMANIRPEDINRSLKEAFESIDPQAIKQEIDAIYRNIIDTRNYSEALKYFNSKGLIFEIAKLFDMKSDALHSLILRLATGSYGEKVFTAIKPYLPEELIEEDTSRTTCSHDPS